MNWNPHVNRLIGDPETRQMGKNAAIRSTRESVKLHFDSKKATTTEGPKKPGHHKKPAVQWFAERTSMHGVPSLIQSHTKKSKAFWAIVCLLGMGMFLYMLISLFVHYFSYPTVIKVNQVSRAIDCAAS